MSRQFHFRQLRQNLTSVSIGKMTIIISYDTPVAITAPDGERYKTQRKFSSTTSRHIKVAGYADASERPHEDLMQLIDLYIYTGSEK